MAGFNHPDSGTDSEVLIPPNVQYVIGVDNVDNVQLPIGSRQSVTYTPETNTLTFYLAEQDTTDLDKYLGSHATPPTTRNNGGALESGDIYYDGTFSSLYVWNGDTWSTFNPSETVKTIYPFTATAGQTSFTATYSAGNVDVFINGILQLPSSYTSSSGTEIVLSVGAELNDEVVIFAYNSWQSIMSPVFANATYVVDTIADLANIDETAYGCAIVKEEGRGGTFNYDPTQSAVNNGGTIFDGWVREYSGAVNVKWFGAKGDGVTDDSTALQSAYTTARHIYIPAGTYLANSISISATCLTYGDGVNRTTLTPYATGDVFNITGSGDYVLFRHISFRHDRSFVANAIVFNAIANNRWCHMDTVYFDGFNGSAIKCSNIILETVFSRLKVTKCGSATSPAIHMLNPSADGDNINNVTIRDLALFAPQGVGLKIESELDSSPLPGSRTVRILDSLIHGGSDSGAVSPPYSADLVQINGATDPIITGTSFRQIADGKRAINITSALATTNRGGIIDNCLFGSFETNWKGIVVDNTQDFKIGVNRFVTTGCTEHIRLGSGCIRIYLERQNTYIGTSPVIVNNGTTTRGYIDEQKLSLDYIGTVSLSGIKGLNGAKNIAGSESIPTGTTATVTFANAEVDTNYIIVLSPNANVTAWWSGKSVNGFTINISAVVATTVTWSIVRA